MRVCFFTFYFTLPTCSLNYRLWPLQTSQKGIPFQNPEKKQLGPYLCGDSASELKRLSSERNEWKIFFSLNLSFVSIPTFCFCSFLKRTLLNQQWKQRFKNGKRNKKRCYHKDILATAVKKDLPFRNDSQHFYRPALPLALISVSPHVQWKPIKRTYHSVAV